ncbi:sulfotransferase family protein [bacterium]|nr:sulfotransferase family protein [bacterium]MBU1651512.1 sulfotransferase family protein [bacterium]MBU1882081.1 sulfotransferase family protein [bacterium]
MAAATSGAQSLDKRPLAYIHLFKTAGTTLESIISRQYGMNAIMKFGSVVETADRMREFSSWPEAYQQRIKAFMGHCSYKQRSLFPKDTVFFSMIRHPVDRMISEYYFILASPEIVHYPKVVGEKMSLTDFMRSGIHNSLDNYQTKYLSSLKNPGFGVYSEELLEDAKKNLKENFAFTGLTERFDESVILMKRLFGWKLPYYMRERVTKRRPRREEVPAGDIAVLEEYNRMDLELYQYAEELLDEEIGKQGNGYESDLKTFKLINKHCTSLGSSLSQIPLANNDEFILLLQTINKTLDQRTFDEVELLMEFGRQRFPNMPEMTSIEAMVNIQLQNLRKVNALRDTVISTTKRVEGIDLDADTL